VSYWACAQLEARRDRERIALHCLGLAGYETYAPRLRERVLRNGRRIWTIMPLFIGYAFVRIELQWHTARWAAGVIRLVMDGAAPAKVPEGVIEDLRRRERDGLVVIPKKGLLIGGQVRVVAGPFSGRLAIFAGMKPRERCEVLLALLGGQQRTIIPLANVESIENFESTEGS
jgi:transcriptional antiterminator RfaH